MQKEDAKMVTDSAMSMAADCINLKLSYVECSKQGMHYGEVCNMVCVEPSCLEDLICCCACIEESHKKHL